VVDQHRLLLSPVCPALAADLLHDPRTDGPRERRSLESFSCLPAPRAGYISHCYDLAY
jgi:hypothetical protein